MTLNTLVIDLKRRSRSTPRASFIGLVRRLVAVPVLFLAVGGVLLPTPVNGQVVAAAGPQRATRAQLSERVAELERQLAANMKGVDRNRTMAEIAGIKLRLEEGDFRVGNQFVVTVTSALQTVSDTVTVRDSLMVTFAKLPDASVRGVLRSELNERLSAHVARFLRDAQVRVNVLTRITILGAVGRQGQYYASPDRPIGELVMLAGGPAQDAKLDQLQITRSGRTVLSSKDSKRALKEGRTLEQLDVQSGDDVTIPKKRRINWSQIFQVIAVISTLFFTVIQFLRYYYESQG